MEPPLYGESDNEGCLKWGSNSDIEHTLFIYIYLYNQFTILDDFFLNLRLMWLVTFGICSMMPRFVSIL